MNRKHILSLDIGNEHVNVRFPSGRLVPVLISEFPDFQATVLKGEEWGEDKELAAKKKAMQERVAMLEKRKERQRLRAHAKAVKSRNERIAKSEKRADPPKVAPKAKAQAVQPQQNSSRKRRRNKKTPKSDN